MDEEGTYGQNLNKLQRLYSLIFIKNTFKNAINKTKQEQDGYLSPLSTPIRY